MLDALSKGHATCESMVLSAYGERADWYQNIMAHAAIEISLRCTASGYTSDRDLSTAWSILRLGRELRRPHLFALTFAWEIS